MIGTIPSLVQMARNEDEMRLLSMLESILRKLVQEVDAKVPTVYDDPAYWMGL